jgi:uncharacterized membrane protein
MNKPTFVLIHSGASKFPHHEPSEVIVSQNRNAYEDRFRVAQNTRASDCDDNVILRFRKLAQADHRKQEKRTRSTHSAFA